MRRGLVLLALAFSCATFHPPPDATRCPDSGGRYCVGAPVCSYDRDRGCFLCECSDFTKPAPYPPPDTHLPVTR